MSSDRYDLQLNETGQWSVIDLTTMCPAHHRNHVMVRMTMDEADAAADMLNQLQRCSKPLAHGAWGAAGRS